eukprot:TRINITY_DN6383_c0_g1_i1.p1 TRINITY_DN6383_c0_g1~~TRINITY_DN6383_c0_g1_i1.p1  ORF type:complete len:140 (+),score=21.45 TRINITY_DN6383_c0_g1_i1:64-483(+)
MCIRDSYWCDPQTFHLTYNENDILQYWGYEKLLISLGQMYPRNKFIFSPGDVLYLDCGMGNKYGDKSWCGNFNSWLKMYKFEPTNYHIAQERILGAEAGAWSEQMTDFNIELNLWPRLAGMSETLWMPKRDTEMNLTSI